MLNYCYQHADRPNPLQDLIDKGFLSLNFKGETCLSVNQTYNDVLTRIREVETRINERNKNLTTEFEEKQRRALESICGDNETTTYQKCQSIYGE
jgi:hypothetical protein